MSTLEKVKKMQQEAKTEDEIITILREEGVAYRDISEALAQSKIRAAVEEPAGEDDAPQTPPPAPDAYAPPPAQGYDNQYYQQDYDYQQQQPAYDPGAASTDTVTEIAEQVVAEKLSVVAKAMEKMKGDTNSLTTKIEIIEERVKRIEKIIDTLQLSVLQKVGDYITNVNDIKKELIETQKSFAKVVPELKKARRAPTKKRIKKKK